VNSAVEVQLHLWPWSVGNPGETVNIHEGQVAAPFYGSPVLSVSSGAQVVLARRYENFLPFGPEYATSYGPCQLYQVPHGVIAEKRSKSTRVQNENKLPTSLTIISEAFDRQEIQLNMQGAVSSTDNDRQNESPLYRNVLAWSNYFDECIHEASSSSRHGKLPWKNIINYLRRLASKDKEPRMALIVLIAERMRQQLPMVVHAARRILVRERTMIHAPRLAETDAACLRWYIRQPGVTSAQKAAANRHRLLGVTRKESLDTLENMVLKDFLERCNSECRRYLNFDCTDNQRTNSERGRCVNAYSAICTELKRLPQIDGISPPPVGIRPNYVLQNDPRYKKIWEHYVKLLRHEDEEDRLWDWQSRTWADIARMLVNASLISLVEEGTDSHFFALEEILQSVFSIYPEQKLGARIARGSEPGPFLIKPLEGKRGKEIILETVHPSLAHDHESTTSLGRMGGHLYLVLTPLDGSQQTVLVLWAVHTASGAALQLVSWGEISESASEALKRHSIIMGERATQLPRLHAFVLASDMDSETPDLFTSNDGSVHLVKVPTYQKSWNSAVEYIALILEEILGATL